MDEKKYPKNKNNLKNLLQCLKKLSNYLDNKVKLHRTLKTNCTI